MSEKQHSRLGPGRAQLQATPEGRQAAGEWLRQPVGHTGISAQTLLVKLALLDRAGVDPADLLQAQLATIAWALASQIRIATGYDRVLAWRLGSVLATLRFVDARLASVPARRAGTARG